MNEVETTPQDQVAEALKHAVAGEFDVVRAVAIGGMATIFQLRHVRTGGLFAGKIMRPELAREPQFQAAFEREARVGALLAGHPNAVPVLDVRRANDLPWLLMPYIEGEDLDTLLSAMLAREGRFGREESLMLLAQLGSLLMYAEKLGVVHADVSLGNIRLDPFGQYRLFDYGLARTADPSAGGHAELSALAGTPAASSPEQLRGERLDIRSDLYSLGLVFFHTLTGQPAFESTDLAELAAAHLAGTWSLPEEFKDDPAIVALLDKMLATEREQRFSSAFELGGAVEALGYQLPSVARVLPGMAQKPPKMRRRRLEP